MFIRYSDKMTIDIIILRLFTLLPRINFFDVWIALVVGRAKQRFNRSISSVPVSKLMPLMCLGHVYSDHQVRIWDTTGGLSNWFVSSFDFVYQGASNIWVLIQGVKVWWFCRCTVKLFPRGCCSLFCRPKFVVILKRGSVHRELKGCLFLFH